MVLAVSLALPFGLDCRREAVAADAERSAAVNAAFWEDGQGRTTYQPEDRRRLAETLANYWQEMSERTAELARKDPDATSTKRYDLWPLSSLAGSVAGCAQSYRELAAMAGTNDRKEALRWAKSVNCYDMNTRVNLAEAGLGTDEDRKWIVKFPIHTLWSAMITGPLLTYMLDETRFR